MVSAWITKVKAYAAANGVSYKQALIANKGTGAGRKKKAKTARVYKAKVCTTAEDRAADPRCAEKDNLNCFNRGGKTMCFKGVDQATRADIRTTNKINRMIGVVPPKREKGQPSVKKLIEGLIPAPKQRRPMPYPPKPAPAPKPKTKSQTKSMEQIKKAAETLKALQDVVQRTAEKINKLKAKKAVKKTLSPPPKKVVTGRKKQGRPKGAKNKESVKPPKKKAKK